MILKIIERLNPNIIIVISDIFIYRIVGIIFGKKIYGKLKRSLFENKDEEKR
jgi:hypothetical protein